MSKMLEGIIPGAEMTREGGRFNDLQQRAYLNYFHTKNAGDETFFSTLTDDHERISYDWIVSRAQEVLASSKSPTFFDVGCGDGGLLKRLSAIKVDSRLIGVDLCQAQLSLAKERFSERDHTQLICGAADTLPLGADVVDLATSHYSLMLLKPLKSSILEIRRVLKPGCSFLAALPAPWAKPSKQLPLLQALVTSKMREVFPTFPDIGLVNDECLDSESLVSAFESAGFDVKISVKEFTLRGEPSDILAFLKGLYWFDLYPKPRRPELESELMRILDDAKSDDGLVSWGRTVCLLEARKSVEGR